MHDNFEGTLFLVHSGEFYGHLYCQINKPPSDAYVATVPGLEFTAHLGAKIIVTSLQKGGLPFLTKISFSV